jgi:hypothetical protein
MVKTSHGSWQWLGPFTRPDSNKSRGCHPRANAAVHRWRAPLFRRAHEIIHSKDTLQFRAFIRIIEIHDFSIPKPDKGYSSSNSDWADGQPGDAPGGGLSQPWPHVYRLDVCASSGGDHRSVFPLYGVGMAWPSGVPSRHAAASRGPPVVVERINSL